jgi:tetratricopeptide (TPR) repeat protein
MRLRLWLVVPMLAVAGCRSDVKEVRLDLVQAARLMRAYGSAKAAAPTPPEATQLSPERLNDLGVMLERRGMLDRAERHYRMALEQAPGFARAWVNLGNVARRRGQAAEALGHYRRAMQEDPTLFEAVNNFADLCADCGRCVGEALALLAPAVDKHPPEENVGRDTLGKLLMRGGRCGEAAAAFRTALDLTDPRERELRAEILRHLAQAYRALGDVEAARSAELRAGALE